MRRALPPQARRGQDLTPGSVTAPDFEVCDVLPDEPAAIVDNGLGNYNDQVAPLDLVERLGVFARDRDAVIGGALGRTWGTLCELQQLWVDPAWRRRGVARELVQRFEARAFERGCREAYLFTFSFQAPAFYRSLGYAAAHTLRGYPQAIEQYLMTKPLRAASMS